MASRCSGVSAERAFLIRCSSSLFSRFRSGDWSKSLDIFEDEGLVERAGRIGDTVRGRMSAWQDRHPQIGDVRGLGAMLAIELVRDPATKEPAPELAARVIEEAAQRGLLLLRAGVHSNCIRELAPLVKRVPDLVQPVWLLITE